ncbi:Vacuolar protein sorting-associated protein 13B [Zootermopsis nevadensis]|uniref:Vacuolar protein sorting-associated protein 13B n=1 Tax=Zootermopsis nevadensis TaxID=136037 RepID=A0A067RGP1_ZOONE|nr:Vacuolar protein sorting-associated protein 13B [Zootermopsis nevadensis]
MFKLESYITPILLSYVDKYIKNFRPEDSQVSLWGGDASFHNLDLRLEVLEQELQLPFSFVSGHIHELLIHVPWTKLASEPITITINTIECILKLHGEDSVGSDSASHASSATNTSKDSRRKANKRQDVVAPPGYVQSLVNKIVSNITILCNNLILKYVEEDIVLSVNVKTVTLQSADKSWQPAFTDLSPTQIMLRKLVSLADLTICLDKRNASGKIEMYQEPLLYRCSMELHLLRSYQNATAKRVAMTRADIHCGRMDFSLTEQQVPMLMRLALLAIALHGKELRQEQSQNVEQDLDTMQDSVPVTVTDSTNESWAGWAWSWVPSVMPIYWNEDWSAEHHRAYVGHTYHTGFYVEQASVSLKVTESSPDWSYYGPRKVKFIPFLVIQLQGCFVDFVMHGAGWLNVQTGVSQVTVEPYGDCFCGVKEAAISTSAIEMKDHKVTGNEQNNYLADSLFDPAAVENKGEKKTYNMSWEDHLSTVTEALLLERSPAIAVDFLYMLELPDDFNSERLSELGSDLEYSNLPEKSLCRVVVGPVAVKVCSGLLHRLQIVQHAARLYDYSPYSTPKPEPSREQLPPPSAEDYDSLDNNIPKQVIQVTLFKSVINIHLADHPVFDPVMLQAPRKHRKTKPLSKQMTHLPKVTLECQCFDARIVKPMYPWRLVITTCQLPAPSQHMFHACHFHANVKVSYLCCVSSQLVLSPGSQTTVLMPSNLSYTRQNLMLTRYWNNPDIPHTDQTLKAESLTMTFTKAKLMVISNIIQSQFDPTSAFDIIQNSTLLTDAAKHAGVEYLELCVEEISYRQVITPGTEGFILNVGALKAFVLEFPLNHGASRPHGNMFDVLSEPQQALVLSGPESLSFLEAVDPNQIVQQPLLCLTLQYTRDPSVQDHPPLLFFSVREIRACVDPMMWRWLRYAPDCIVTRSDLCTLDTNITTCSSTVHRRSRRLSSEASGGTGLETGPARRAPTPQESVHSSSDREQIVVQTGLSLDNILRWFPVWRGMVLSGDVAQCVIYLPMASLSAVGAQSIEDALAQCLSSKTSPPPEVLVMTLPFLTLRSASQKQALHQYTSRLPVRLPESVWTKDKVNFPWSLALADLSCYTLQNGTKLHFLKPVSANATVGISAKYQNDDEVLGTLGVCVHVDTTPVNISLSQEQVRVLLQMRLMTSVLLELLEFFSSLQFFSIFSSETGSAPDQPTPVSPTIFPESSGSRESPTTPLVTQDSNEQHTVKITVWMQSTLARLRISLYALNDSAPKDELKLTVDMEDIMTSLDLQPVYLKVKCKVAYANILHYIRKPKSTSWRLGPYAGLVMRRQENLASPPPHAVHRDVDDGSGFLSVTFTCAKCRNVHSRWGTRKQTTLLANARSCDTSVGLQDDTLAARYISEIVVKVQPVDFVFSATTLGSFLTVMYPILKLPEHKQIFSQKKNIGAASNWTMDINNSTLPLLYLDTCNIRIILPASEMTVVGYMHNVYLLQVEAISLTPQADNPLGRIVVRSDIYHMAEQTRMLCVPGSEVEDRQYQLDIKGFSVNTGTWQELDRCLSLTSLQTTSLRTMSENPALEWNNLVSGKENFTPHMSLNTVIARLNLCIVAAPAIVYHGNILVCGHSLEVNAVTDIEVLISMGQLVLASALLEEVLLLLKPFLADSSTKTLPLVVHATPLMKPISEGSLEMEIAGANYNRKRAVSWKSNVVSSTSEHHRPQDVVPVEILLTAGKVSFSLYELMEGNNRYEAGSEEGSVEDAVPPRKHIQPLLYILMAQPHAFLSRLSFMNKVQISCFDMSITSSEQDHVIPRGIPRPEDFLSVLLETKGGDPHPDTGIPPAFLTVKWSESVGKASKIEVEMGRPTKIYYSIALWRFIDDIQKKLKHCFYVSVFSNWLVGITHVYGNIIGDKQCGVAAVSISSQQLVFQLSGRRHEAEMVVSVAGVTGTMSRIVRGQVDRVMGSVAVSCLMLTTAFRGLSRPLLTPWSSTLDICLAWEPWLSSDSSPQVQLTIDSDCILVDVGPEHLHSLHLIWSEYEPFLNSFQMKSRTELVESVSHPPEQDQHYRDDLRAGAFQFVDASSGFSRDDLPLPYQVVFWQAPPTMAWRYPQPRTLTRVDVFPVPFKVATDHLGQEPKGQVLCSLQYWSDCRACYLPYAQFQLSESEMYRLELPTSPHKVVACTWRVQLTLQSEEDDELHDSRDVLVSPRALAACMRVDSFFASRQVPCLQAAMNISSLQVSLYNHVISSNAGKPLPLPLKNFSVDQMTPESQCFMSIALDSTCLYVCMWSSGNVSMVEMNSRVRCDIIDYAYLTQQYAIEPFQAKVQLTLGDTTAVSCVTKPIGVRFGPAIGHTLAVSAQLWAQAFRNLCIYFQVIVSRYIICNDMIHPLRFGQALTDEDILLGSCQCHFYSWRTHKVKQVLRVGVEKGAWVWSQPFCIDVDGLQLCGLADCGMKDISIVVKVSSLSATQKQVTLSGQLVVTNLLAEHLECRILPMVDEASGPQDEEQNFIAVGKSTPPSVLIDANCKMTLRIRFHGLDSVWSGDIPVRENCRSGQPWLVKVPLHDRGQFLSVWCRVLCQHIGQGVKILAMLCPLYMIRSYLPVPAKVLIDTPGLRVHLQATVHGRGEQQQLYCPGTVDHSHKLTFQLENGITPSNPYVPLSYTVIDQRKFLKIDDKDVDINAIVASLSEVKTPVWPFVGEEYANVSWISAEQPQTDVQVKYVPQGPFCSTLLVELQPWALLVNVVGYPIVLIVEERTVCRVPHQGVVTPPKLEHTFSLGMDVGDIVHASPPLQLARPDWGNSFYMPRISGLLPNSGNVQTVVQYGKTLGYLSIASKIVEEMRVITVRAKYIICNRTSLNLQVSALVVRESERHSYFLTQEEQRCVHIVLPDTEDKSNMGRPIAQWALLGKEEGEGELVPYIMLNSGAGWSCPLWVNDGIVRHSFSIPIPMDSDGVSNCAYVLTVQEYLGQVFLSVYPEIHPQITLHNTCSFKILCAQGTPDNDGKAVEETSNFDWWCSVAAHSSAHYSLPAASERFPDIVSPGNWPPLVLALSDSFPQREGTLLWSRGVSITETQEQFVRLPGHGDVKIRIEVVCHTTHVTVETVSHVEISARDIRSRLMRHQEDTEPAVVEMLFHHASLPQSRTSCASQYLSASDSSQMELGHKMSDTSLISADIPKPRSERTEIVLLSLDNVCISVKPQFVREDSEELNVCVTIGDLQLDNQMFQRGGFDFPVILIGQVPKRNLGCGFSLSVPASCLMEQFSSDSLIVFNASLEMLNNGEGSCSVMKQLKVSFGPLCAYIEDTLITKLTEYLTCLLPTTLILSPPSDSGSSLPPSASLVPIPKITCWDSRQVAFPLRLRTLTIQPLSLLLSVRTSVKLYIALDHSPLQFSAFERSTLITTSYQLGHTLTMHYLSGAIFGAGWMVGSLELLGSPGGFARTLGTGLRDFVSLPYHGIFEGPWGFLVGVTHGSASLMKHVTAGTLSSVTKLAASVARNLDRLTLDQEHLARTEELRRRRPQGVTQGLLQGLTGLGISLLGAVGGIAHHPLQSVMSEGASTRGLVTGVGLGLVGAITKPLSGAAELVALAGQGLLHGAGWTSLPEMRQQSVTEYAFSGANSRLKYSWKLIAELGVGSHSLLHVTEATGLTPSGSYEAVALVLTTRALFLVDTEEDVTRRVLSLAEVSGMEHASDPTLLCFRFQTAVEMEAASRARVVDFVRHSSGMVPDIAPDGAQSEAESSFSGSPILSEPPGSTDASLMFYVNPQLRNYFLSVLALAKRQSEGRGFAVL